MQAFFYYNPFDLIHQLDINNIANNIATIIIVRWLLITKCINSINIIVSLDYTLLSTVLVTAHTEFSVRNSLMEYNLMPLLHDA